jgi:hypothetical protein
VVRVVSRRVRRSHDAVVGERQGALAVLADDLSAGGAFRTGADDGLLTRLLDGDRPVAVGVLFRRDSGPVLAEPLNGLDRVQRDLGPLRRWSDGGEGPAATLLDVRAVPVAADLAAVGVIGIGCRGDAAVAVATTASYLPKRPVSSEPGPLAEWAAYA